MTHCKKFYWTWRDKNTKWRVLHFLNVSCRWCAEVMAFHASLKSWVTVLCAWPLTEVWWLPCIIHKQQRKTPKLFKILCLNLLAYSHFVLLGFGKAFALFLWRDNHSVDDDDAEHQRKTFTAKSILCYCHGLVHSGLLCLCVLCSYRVCCCQLFY